MPVTQTEKLQDGEAFMPQLRDCASYEAGQGLVLGLRQPSPPSVAEAQIWAAIDCGVAGTFQPLLH